MIDRRSLFWMRRDLRAHDNVALHAALSASCRAFAKEDYEPSARRRDQAIATDLARDGRELVLSKDAWLHRLGQDDELLGDWLPALAPIDPRHLHEPWKRESPIPDYPAPVVDLAASVEECKRRYARERAQPYS